MRVVSAALSVACARCDDADALRAEIARLRTRLSTVVVLADVLAERAADYESQAARESAAANATPSERSYAREAGALSAVLTVAVGSAEVIAQQIRCAATGTPMPREEWLAAAVDDLAAPSTETDPTILDDLSRWIAEDHEAWCRGLVKP